MPLLFGWCIIAKQMIYWFVHIFILGTLAWLFYRKFHSGFSLWVYASALLMKLLAGIVVGLIFINYYQQGDTIVFFEKSQVIASLPFTEYLANLFSPSNYLTTGQPRVLFFTKFLSFFTLITGESYWISSLYLSTISFFSSWYLVVTLAKQYKHLKEVFIVCFLFIPTIVFWSSGILKDSLSFSALSYSVTLIIKLHKKDRVLIQEWLLSIIAIFMLYKVKHYLLIALILFVGLLIFCTLISKPKLSTKIVATVIMTAALLATQLIHPYLKFDRIALTIYENNHTILAKSDSENRLHIAIDAPTTN